MSAVPERVFCAFCGKPLQRDEAALNIKLNGEEPDAFLCLRCLAEDYGVTVRELQLKIEDFRQSGCTLFSD